MKKRSLCINELFQLICSEYPGEEHAVRILLICDWERKIPKFQETKVKGYSWVSFNKKNN